MGPKYPVVLILCMTYFVRSCIWPSK